VSGAPDRCSACPLVKQGRLVALSTLKQPGCQCLHAGPTAVLRVLGLAGGDGAERQPALPRAPGAGIEDPRLVDAHVVGVLISHLDGQVVERTTPSSTWWGFTRDDLASGRSVDERPSEWQAASQRAVGNYGATGSADLFEKGISGRTAAGASAGRRRGRRGHPGPDRRVRRRPQGAEAARKRSFAREGARTRVTRVSTVGELAASIAHEINHRSPPSQPAGARCSGFSAIRRPREGADALKRTMHEAEHAGRSSRVSVPC